MRTNKNLPNQYCCDNVVSITLLVKFNINKAMDTTLLQQFHNNIEVSSYE